MLDKKYDFKSVEENKYDEWKASFESNDHNKEPFAIVLPPPNVTGKLHLGHALDVTIQDVIIRYKKMQGFDAIWVPGMDHAGIATQGKIDAKLRGEGIDPRSLGRDAWLKQAFLWKDEYAKNIHEQWAKLGLCLTYSKERFTLDESVNKSVNKVFVDLYNEGLIYKGKRMINWDPGLMTALSNEEVEYKEIEGAFYHIKYYLEDKSKFLEVATTRPETLFGDTALAVNPKDERYKDLIGKNVILPIVNKLIPIVADEHADMEFGTGVVKITPAHDPNDFEVGKRHNLEIVTCINKDGTLNERTGKYQGLDRFIAREKIVEELKKLDLLVSVKRITHSVGHSQRSGQIVEPYLSTQWFVKMRPLADKVLDNQKNKDTKVNFIPKNYEKTMNHWMEITYDWCISRQLWWGHRIPAWYKDDEIYVGINPPVGDGWIQDEDVLDTWFSSALWPFSTLGWPNNTEDLRIYYPNSVLVTAYDIIPFWVNRMTFQGLHFMGERPFKDCIIHGLVRDEMGRKMSKSLGNGIDPMDLINEYGADSLRFMLSTSTSIGIDLLFNKEKVASSWNFINKLWNASRYVLMNIENLKAIDLNDLSLIDKWILIKLNNTIKEVTKFMDKYELNNAGNKIYQFVWNDFCDNYIEMSKHSLNPSVLYYVLENILKLLHPFMPFVTDELYNNLPFNNDNILLSEYPKYNKLYNFKEELNSVNEMIDFIKLYRNVTKENNIPNGSLIKLNTKFDDILLKILKINNLVDKDQNIMKYEVNNNTYSLTIYYEKVETEEQKLLREKEITRVEQAILKRTKLLENPGFISKAPKELISEEERKLESDKNTLKTLTGGL